MRARKATERSKASLAAEPVKAYVDVNEWQTQAIEEAVKKADRRGARFIGSMRGSPRGVRRGNVPSSREPAENGLIPDWRPSKIPESDTGRTIPIPEPKC